MAFQEPCCISRNIPALLREQGWYVFQTNGDITVDKFMEACSSMVGDRHKLILAIPTIRVSLLRVINYYLQREWTTEVHLITQENQKKLVSNELLAHNTKVHYVWHKNIYEGLIVFEGEKDTCIIQGYMTEDITPGYHQYCAYFGNDKQRIEDMISPIKSKIRIAEHTKEI